MHGYQFTRNHKRLLLHHKKSQHIKILYEINNDCFYSDWFMRSHQYTTIYWTSFVGHLLEVFPERCTKSQTTTNVGMGNNASDR